MLHVTSCFNRILPAILLIHKTSQVFKMLKLNLFMSVKNLWRMISRHNKMFSIKTMTMICLLNQEIDTPSDNCNHLDTHVYENQDDILIHASNLSHTFALPQFMAQPNCEAWIPLTLQMRYQLPTKSPVITP